MAWIIYLISLVDGFRKLTMCLSLLGGIIAIVTWGVGKGNEDFDEEFSKLMVQIFKFCRIIFFITIPFALFLPSSKTIAAMYLIPKIISNEDVQKVPDKVLTIMNGKLDQWIDDMKEGE